LKAFLFIFAIFTTKILMLEKELWNGFR